MAGGKSTPRSLRQLRGHVRRHGLPAIRAQCRPSMSPRRLTAWGQGAKAFDDLHHAVLSKQTARFLTAWRLSAVRNASRAGEFGLVGRGREHASGMIGVDAPFHPGSDGRHPARCVAGCPRSLRAVCRRTVSPVEVPDLHRRGPRSGFAYGCRVGANQRRSQSRDWMTSRSSCVRSPVGTSPTCGRSMSTPPSSAPPSGRTRRDSPTCRSRSWSETARP